jgi:hypothetical protein
MNWIQQRLQAAGSYMKNLGEVARHPVNTWNYIQDTNKRVQDESLNRAKQSLNAPPSQRFQQRMQAIEAQNQQYRQNHNFQQKPQQNISPKTTPRVHYNVGIDPTIVNRLKEQRAMVDEIKKQFGNEAQLALAVNLAESRGNPTVKNYGPTTHAAGAWQFQPATWQEMGGGDLNGRFDPILSTQKAKVLRDKRGWSQWDAYNNGAYKDFMDYYNNLK